MPQPAILGHGAIFDVDEDLRPDRCRLGLLHRFGQRRFAHGDWVQALAQHAGRLTREPGSGFAGVHEPGAFAAAEIERGYAARLCWHEPDDGKRLALLAEAFDPGLTAAGAVRRILELGDNPLNLHLATARLDRRTVFREVLAVEEALRCAGQDRVKGLLACEQ